MTLNDFIQHMTEDEIIEICTFDEVFGDYYIIFYGTLHQYKMWICQKMFGDYTVIKYEKIKNHECTSIITICRE